MQGQLRGAGAGTGAAAGAGAGDGVEPPPPPPQAATSKARDVNNRDRGKPAMRLEKWEAASGNESFIKGRRGSVIQYIGRGLVASAGTACVVSQCSAILPLATRKMSTITISGPECRVEVLLGDERIDLVAHKIDLSSASGGSMTRACRHAASAPSSKFLSHRRKWPSASTHRRRRRWRPRHSSPTARCAIRSTGSSGERRNDRR